MDIIARAPFPPGVTPYLYADDIVLIHEGRNHQDSFDTLQQTCQTLENVCRKARMRINPAKSSLLCVTRCMTPHVELEIFGGQIPNVSHMKILGITYHKRGNFGHHARELRRKMFPILRRTSLFKKYPRLKSMVIKSKLIPVLLYGSAAWAANVPDVRIRGVERILMKAIKKMYFLPLWISNLYAYHLAKIQPLREIIRESARRGLTRFGDPEDQEQYQNSNHRLQDIKFPSP